MKKPTSCFLYFFIILSAFTTIGCKTTPPSTKHLILYQETAKKLDYQLRQKTPIFNHVQDSAHQLVENGVRILQDYFNTQDICEMYQNELDNINETMDGPSFKAFFELNNRKNTSHQCKEASIILKNPLEIAHLFTKEIQYNEEIQKNLLNLLEEVQIQLSKLWLPKNPNNLF